MIKVRVPQSMLSNGVYRLTGKRWLHVSGPMHFTSFRRGSTTFRTNLDYDRTLRIDYEGAYIACAFYGPNDMKYYAIAEYAEGDDSDQVYPVSHVLCFPTNEEHRIILALETWVAKLQYDLRVLGNLEEAKAFIDTWNNAFPNVNILAFRDDEITIALPRKGYDYTEWKGCIHIKTSTCIDDYRLVLLEKINNDEWDQSDVFSCFDELAFDQARHYFDGFVRLVKEGK